MVNIFFPNYAYNLRTTSYIPVFRKMALNRNRRRSSWTAWNFVYPKGWDFAWADKTLRWRHFQHPHQRRIPRKREISAMVDVTDDVNSVRCNLTLPQQVRLIRVWIRKKYWCGRGWRYSYKCLCTVRHPEENGCSVFTGML